MSLGIQPTQSIKKDFPKRDMTSHIITQLKLIEFGPFSEYF